LTWAAAPAEATTETFFYTGSEQTFIVPVGVFSVHVAAIGGSGGASDAAGGEAAQVNANLAVTSGQTLYIEVGGKGKSSGEGGGAAFNGGAAHGGGGSPVAAGGGGASDVRTLPGPSLVTDSRLIVAGGGGGGGGTGLGEGPGAGGAAGSPGVASGAGNGGGGEGTQIAGGSGGVGIGNSNGGEGQLGLGGSGGESCGPGGGGGGGGGGYYGGGGGGPGCEVTGGGGGGGGSSLVPAGGSFSLASLATAPQVQISYSLTPPSISIAFPVNGATYTQGQAVSAVYSCTPHEGAAIAACTGPVPNGAAFNTGALGPHTFTVKAEDSNGATASEGVSYTVVAASAPTPPVTTPILPPDTLLAAHPKKKIETEQKKVKVKFSFSSTVAGATFECKLDNGPFAPCTSPKSYKVKPGKHKFSVEAVSTGGTDSSAASFKFTVKKKS
jgi:hypothetical protein